MVNGISHNEVDQADTVIRKVCVQKVTYSLIYSPWYMS